MSDFDDALDMVDELHEDGTLNYGQYSALHDAISTLGSKPTWRNSEDDRRLKTWLNNMHHDEPANLVELIEEIIWTAWMVDMGPNGNTFQGIDEGEVQTDGIVRYWADIAATLGRGECEIERRDNPWGGYTVHCGNCGADLDCDTRNSPQKFCPKCGRRVKR